MLGLVEADDAAKAKSARTALVASRTNVLLSIPMLYAMATYQTLGSWRAVAAPRDLVAGKLDAGTVHWAPARAR